MARDADDARGETLYLEAVNRLLAGIDPAGSGGTSTRADRGGGTAALVQVWPLAFRDELERYRPAGQRVRAAVQWPAIPAGFRRELAQRSAATEVEGRN